MAVEEDGAVAVEANKDRFGLSWRPELAAGVLLNRGRVDCIEVISDDYLDADAKRVRALVALSRELPVLLHSIHLGPATTSRVEDAPIEKLARLVDRIRPESWSEHVAFVRAGGIEVGHLAAPPRDAATVDGTLANLDRIRRLTGTAPEIENIATLIEPPGSTMTEQAWLTAIFAACPNGWLFDLHNVYANAINFGFDVREFLASLPPDRVHTIHLAGGKWIEDRAEHRRYLDDHLHPVPGPVYDLLAFTAARAPRPLTVILERDGDFPPTADLLAELDLARAAVARGRKVLHDHAAI